MTIRLTTLIGFSPFETLTLESFFRLAGRRSPGYSIVADPNAAHVLIVNADEASRVQELWAKGPLAKVVLIGASDFGTSWVTMPRPIRLLAVLEKIEELMRSGPIQAPQVAAGATGGAVFTSSAAPTPVSAPVSVSVSVPVSASAAMAVPAKRPEFQPTAAHLPPEFASSAPAAPAAPAQKSRSGPVSIGFANSTGFGMGPAKAPTPAVPKDDDDLILVVDDSDIVLRFMQGRLQRFGFSVALASTGEQAIEMAKVRHYKFVFLDVMMPGIDGYQTCRMVKKIKAPNGTTPVVVMLSSRGGTIDKIRGTLAGADAYLTKPLAEAALVKVLAEHDTQTAASFSNTRAMSGVS